MWFRRRQRYDGIHSARFHGSGTGHFEARGPRACVPSGWQSERTFTMPEVSSKLRVYTRKAMSASLSPTRDHPTSWARLITSRTRLGVD